MKGNYQEKLKSCGTDKAEKGMVLVIAIAIMAVLTLISTYAVRTTTTDIRITSNFKTSTQSFSMAENGLQEARARLRANAGANRIQDDSPTDYSGDPDWKAFIGSLTNAVNKGFNPANPKHWRTDSFQTNFEYTVVIEHETDDANNVLYWGDDNNDGVLTKNTTTGRNIYIVTSYGLKSNSNKTVEIEITGLPPISLSATSPVPAPLYVDSNTRIDGDGAFIVGTDACGTDHLHAVATTQNQSSVNLTASPHVDGIGGSNDVDGNVKDIDIEDMIEQLKSEADFSYAVGDPGINSLTGNFTHPIGDNWGTPTGGSPGSPHTPPTVSTCADGNIIYFNASGISDNKINLDGNEAGCGILMVKGNLQVGADFDWYGIILVSGNIRFIGSGNRLVTGAVLAEEGGIGNRVEGNTSIAYCSTAIQNLTRDRPLIILGWREL